MDSKLTLTLDGNVIESAKQIARQSGRSLSDLIENYLVSLIALHKGKPYEVSGGDEFRMNAAEPEITYSARLLSLKGIAKDDGRDYKEQLAEIKRKKHL
jgi:hypothetical protein